MNFSELMQYCIENYREFDDNAKNIECNERGF